jgi:hypothetical protein
MSEKIEKVKLTTRQILLYIIDGLVAFNKPFDRHQLYRKNISDYFSWREFDKKRFSDDLKRLEREGIIKVYQKNDVGQIELSHKGIEKVKLIIAKEYKFEYPKKWDYKWRMVIFDIPERKKHTRDVFRWKLEEIGFVKLQESVFVFPFDCKEIVDYFVNIFLLKHCVQYAVAETIETQLDLVKLFVRRGILNRSMLTVIKEKK